MIGAQTWAVASLLLVHFTYLVEEKPDVSPKKCFTGHIYCFHTGYLYRQKEASVSQNWHQPETNCQTFVFLFWHFVTIKIKR